MSFLWQMRNLDTKHQKGPFLAKCYHSHQFSKSTNIEVFIWYTSSWWRLNKLSVLWKAQNACQSGIRPYTERFPYTSHQYREWERAYCHSSSARLISGSNIKWTDHLVYYHGRHCPSQGSFAVRYSNASIIIRRSFDGVEIAICSVRHFLAHGPSVFLQ